MLRILVTGSRDLTDAALVESALYQAAVGRCVLVVGDCPTGADKFARDYWAKSTMPIEVFRADWTAHGKAAGPLRNQAMVDSGVDKCLAFYREGAGNRGTSHCVRAARTAGVPVKEFTDHQLVTPDPFSRGL